MANIHLQTDVERRHIVRTLVVEALGDMDTVNALSPAAALSDKPGLVRLDGTDEVPFDIPVPGLSELFGLVGAFLGVVLAEEALPGIVGLYDVGDRLGLADGEKPYRVLGSVCGLFGGAYIIKDFRQILSYAHNFRL